MTEPMYTYAEAQAKKEKRARLRRIYDYVLAAGILVIVVLFIATLVQDLTNGDEGASDRVVVCIDKGGETTCAAEPIRRNR
jgi:hypothetical protein